MTRPSALSIAGSDPCGGAGIQADLKTFAAWRCHGMAVITALTAQNTAGVRAVHVPPSAFVGQCLDAILEDCPPRAVKTGMLFDAATVRTVAARLQGGRAGPLVVDPVMVATSGDRLSDDEAVRVLREELLPLATLATPNVSEAEVLSGRSIRSESDAWEAAEQIAALGVPAVLVKGGHLGGDRVCDLLWDGSAERRRFERDRVRAARLHGAGCTLSAAITAGLAHGLDVAEAVRRATEWVQAAIRSASPIGSGGVPLDHLVPGPEFLR